MRQFNTHKKTLIAELSTHGKGSEIKSEQYNSHLYSQ